MPMSPTKRVDRVNSVICRPVVGRPVGVQCETVELTTARVQIDENDDAGVKTSLEAQRQCPVVGHEAGCDEDATVVTHHVDSSFEAQRQCLVDEHEAGCDEDASPKSTCGPLDRRGCFK